VAACSSCRDSSAQSEGAGPNCDDHFFLRALECDGRFTSALNRTGDHTDRVDPKRSSRRAN
jgi:hypothetical protein